MFCLHAAASSCTQHVMLRLHAASSSCTQHVMLRLHAASSSCTQHVMLCLHAAASFCTPLVMLRLHAAASSCTLEVGSQFGKALNSAIHQNGQSNYHRNINGPHGSQVNPLLRKRVFQFCWRNSLQSPSPAQFLKHLAKLQCKQKCGGVSFQDDKKLPPLPDVWFPMGRIPG